MNYETAIKILKNEQYASSAEKAEAEKMAIEAMEKQVAKKPTIKPWDSARCPSCGTELSELLGDGYYKHEMSRKFCDCGQLLNWERDKP